MNEQIVNFKSTNLAAQVDERVPFEWQGKEFDSGPLTVELDENASAAQKKPSILLAHKKRTLNSMKE